MWKALISIAMVVIMALPMVSCGDDEELGFDKVSQSYADNLRCRRRHRVANISASRRQDHKRGNHGIGRRQ